MFDYIKKNYEKGIYTKEDVSQFVKAGMITADQYKEITGEDYVA